MGFVRRLTRPRESGSCTWPCAVCNDDFMTPEGHLAEAERLAWVIDEEIQGDAKRTLGDLIALARLHLELSQVTVAQLPRDEEGHATA